MEVKMAVNLDNSGLSDLISGLLKHGHDVSIQNGGNTITVRTNGNGATQVVVDESHHGTSEDVTSTSNPLPTVPLTATPKAQTAGKVSGVKFATQHGPLGNQPVYSSGNHGWTLPAGTRIKSEDTPSLRDYVRNVRQQIITQGAAQDIGEYYLTTREVRLNVSISAVASAIYGTPTSGPAYIKRV